MPEARSLADTPPPLTKKEAAKRLIVTERTIDNWRAAGLIRTIKIGGTVRVPVAEVLRIESEGVMPLAAA